MILIVCLSFKNCHFKNSGTVRGSLFSIPMGYVQTGPTNKYFKLDQVGIGVAYQNVLCTDCA